MQPPLEERAPLARQQPAHRQRRLYGDRADHGQQPFAAADGELCLPGLVEEGHGSSPAEQSNALDAGSLPRSPHG
jgi:hypothetical protein